MHPEYQIGAMALAGLLVVLTYRLIKKFFSNKILRPDPWPPEIEEAIHQEDAVAVCHRCLTPQIGERWFCETCGRAVGPYNNWLPYINIFSEGEVLRNGVTEKIQINAITIVGYILMPLGCYYFIFAPFYWFFFFRNLQRIRSEKTNDHDSQIPPAIP